jgi:hypothetical protein
MILGRPTNLILGAFTAVFNVVVLALNGQGHPIDASIVAGINIAAAALIGLIAYQPPTLNPGATFNVTSPGGQPNYVTTVAVPPAADPAPVATPPTPPVAKGATKP